MEKNKYKHDKSHILIIQNYGMRQIQTLRYVDNSKSPKPKLSPSPFIPCHAGILWTTLLLNFYPVNLQHSIL